MGPDIDWGALLERKYANLEGQTAAETSKAASYGLTSAADANLTNLKAGWVGKQAQADIDESKARTGQINVNTQLAPDLAKASEAASYGGAYRDRGEGAVSYANVPGINQSNAFIGRALGGDQNALGVLTYLHNLTTGGGFTSQQTQPQVNGFGFSLPQQQPQQPPL